MGEKETQRIHTHNTYHAVHLLGPVGGTPNCPLSGPGSLENRTCKKDDSSLKHCLLMARGYDLVHT